MIAFRTSTNAKWVLSGEHAVLRGVAAVALPLAEFSFELEFTPGGTALIVEPASSAPLIHEILGSLAIPPPAGKLRLSSTVPIGAGLGSSAALSVALTRWLAAPLGIVAGNEREFATRIEDRFHGRSSGMDVAAISAGVPILYRLVDGRPHCEALKFAREMRFTFHDTGLRARTSDCVFRVERFRQEHSAVAKRIDQRMALASEIGARALTAHDLGGVSEAMRLAHSCAEEWGLVPDAAATLRKKLRSEGALEVKLTGAGGGGFLVALWPDLLG